MSDYPDEWDRDSDLPHNESDSMRLVGSIVLVLIGFILVCAGFLTASFVMGS